MASPYTPQELERAAQEVHHVLCRATLGLAVECKPQGVKVRAVSADTEWPYLSARRADEARRQPQPLKLALTLDALCSSGRFAPVLRDGRPERWDAKVRYGLWETAMGWQVPVVVEVVERL